MCCSIISLYSLQSPHKYIIINLALLSKRGSSILDHPVFLSFVFVLLFTDECVSFLINNVIINSTFFLPYYLRQYYLCAIKKTRITLQLLFYQSIDLNWDSEQKKLSGFAKFFLVVGRVISRYLTIQSSVLTFDELKSPISFFTVGVEFWKCSAGMFTLLFIN